MRKRLGRLLKSVNQSSLVNKDNQCLTLRPSMILMFPER
jgi:hypothetical protein